MAIPLNPETSECPPAPGDGPPVPDDGPRPARRSEGIRDLAVTALVCLTIALFITTFLAHPMTVPTSSMEPTILVGDRLIVDKLTCRANMFRLDRLLGIGRPVRRGDIIVFKFPLKPEISFVKRVVGLPRETIEVRGRQVWIDGRPLREEYPVFRQDLPDTLLNGLTSRRFGPYPIPAGHYFMMGDNRDNSNDSRFWGPVAERYLIGRPLLIFWSFQDPPNVQEIASPGALFQLYLDRLLHFFSKTRWDRMFHQVGAPKSNLGEVR